MGADVNVDSEIGAALAGMRREVKRLKDESARVRDGSPRKMQPFRIVTPDLIRGDARIAVAEEKLRLAARLWLKA